MEDVEVPEANMLPNVKGFKVLYFLICYYERQLLIFADPKLCVLVGNTTLH